MKLYLSAKMATSRGSIRVPGFPSSSYFTREAKSTTVVGKIVANHRNIMSFAVQESSASAVAAETKEKVPATPAKAAPAKPKPAAKPLPELMEEDVIPPLRAILEAQDDITHLELAYGDNKVQRGFRFPPMVPQSQQRGTLFIAFLVDEKKVTAKLLVFWVEKRLAAQGIIPVWKD